MTDENKDGTVGDFIAVTGGPNDNNVSQTPQMGEYETALYNERYETSLLGPAPTAYTFRHKTIRRFHVGEFEFENFYLTVLGDEKRQQFIDLIRSIPEREAVNIVEVDVEAAMSAERNILNQPRRTVVSGPMTAGDIKTAKDNDASIRQAPGSTIGQSLNPVPAKPTGFSQLNPK